MIRYTSWTLGAALLASCFLLSLPGKACTTTVGGKAATVGGAFVCDCTGGGTGCGCIVEDPTCGARKPVQN